MTINRSAISLCIVGSSLLSNCLSVCLSAFLLFVHHSFPRPARPSIRTCINMLSRVWSKMERILGLVWLFVLRFSTTNSSNRLHHWQVYYREPQEVYYWVWSHLDELFESLGCSCSTPTLCDHLLPRERCRDRAWVNALSLSVALVIPNEASANLSFILTFFITYY